MTKLFLDTNLLVYLATDNEEKSGPVKEVVAASNFSVISLQVLNEFTAVCLRKELLPLPTIRSYIREFIFCFDLADADFAAFNKAFEIREKYKYAWFDCLIIATALLNDCKILYSEDMQHNQKIEKKLTIVNPFL